MATAILTYISTLQKIACSMSMLWKIYLKMRLEFDFRLNSKGL